MASNAARVLLIGKEATWGATGAAVTVKLHGVKDMSLTLDHKSETVPSVGWYGPSPIAERTYIAGEGTMDMALTYEDAPYIFNGLFVATTASLTSAAPYNYPYTAPISSTQACATYVLEYGTTNQAYKLRGGIVNKAVFKGTAGSLWEASMDLIGKNIQTATALTTTANVDRTVNPVAMADTTLYVDAFSTGTVGNTAVSATLIDFELTIDPKRHLKQFAGSINPSNWGDAVMDASLKITAEFNATAKGWVDALMDADTSTSSTGAKVQRQIRIGATNGSSASNKQINLDFAGTLSDPVKLWGDRDGNMTVELNWAGTYSTGLQNWFVANVVRGSSIVS